MPHSRLCLLEDLQCLGLGGELHGGLSVRVLDEPKLNERKGTSEVRAHWVVGMEQRRVGMDAWQSRAEQEDGGAALLPHRDREVGSRLDQLKQLGHVSLLGGHQEDGIARVPACSRTSRGTACLDERRKCASKERKSPLTVSSRYK